MPGKSLFIKLNNNLGALNVCLKLIISMKTKNEFMKIIILSSYFSNAFERICYEVIETHTCEAGTKSASSEPFHLMRNKSSPEESVAPIIRSACKIFCFS